MVTIITTCVQIKHQAIRSETVKMPQIEIPASHQQLMVPKESVAVAVDGLEDIPQLNLTQQKPNQHAMAVEEVDIF
jgi:hypothetical protein